MYAMPLAFIFSYSLVQLNLVINYLRFQRKSIPPSPILNRSEVPYVTIQLPIYNELYVVERLIDAVSSIEYPPNRLEIQVLDDSTDETIELVAQKIAEWQKKGIDIQQIRRTNRQGYKAGALSEGLKTAKGEFIAIFDADFIPKSNFLTITIPYFNTPNIGVVQTRWTHINEKYSLLTQLQAFGLDAHFSIEQSGRIEGGYFINFNGTAGLWRKTCINDAGGWHSDTLTEDLDLSYRAQLNGWKFVYLQQIESPAELPVEISALKSQQFRWMKGAAECARKHIINVLKAPNLSIGAKIHGFFHLTNSTAFICALWLSVLSVPILWVKNHHPEYRNVFLLTSLFQYSLVILGVFYWVSFRHRQDWVTFFWQFPLFLSFMMGLSLHNAIAVIEGFIGKKTPFIRTPKFNIKIQTDKWIRNKYIAKKLSWEVFIEGFLALYFLGAISMAYILQDFGLLPFHLILMLGFSSICGYSIRQTYLRKTYIS